MHSKYKDYAVLYRGIQCLLKTFETAQVKVETMKDLSLRARLRASRDPCSKFRIPVAAAGKAH